jgi:hypothetical protein
MSRYLSVLSSDTREGERFVMALKDLAAHGLLTHCSDPTTSALWLSDDRGERDQAKKLCRGCPVILECGEAGKAWGVTFGVWGGKDLSKNWAGGPRHTGRPKKEKGG